MKIRTLILMAIVVVIFAGCSSNSNQDHDVVNMDSKFFGTWSGNGYTVYISSEEYRITRPSESTSGETETISSRDRYFSTSPAYSSLDETGLILTITAKNPHTDALLCVDVFTLSSSDEDATLKVVLDYVGNMPEDPNSIDLTTPELRKQ